MPSVTKTNALGTQGKANQHKRRYATEPPLLPATLCHHNPNLHNLFIALLPVAHPAFSLSG